MADHPIETLMKTAMENIKDMIDVNTIVGDPVETPDGSVIMPVSRVSCGFAAGGADYQTDGDSHTDQGSLPFGGKRRGCFCAPCRLPGCRTKYCSNAAC